jgi:hypothetical protein
METTDTQKQIDQLKLDIKALNDEIYANNFTAHQDFNKSVSFTTKLKVPHYEIIPTICEVGEICEVGGKLKICSAYNTWTTVGTQS